MKKYDVAIIGGGLTGLTASIYLAKACLSVIIFEKAKELGGRAITVDKNGTMLNLGVHALYQGGAAEEILEELGLQLDGANPPASAITVLNEKVYPLPSGPKALISSRLFNLSEKVEMIRLMMKLQLINPRKLKTMSLKEWAEREVSKPLIRQVVYSICRANSFVPHPELQLAGPAVDRLQRTFTGKAFYVDHGWRQIIDKLKRQAIGKGVNIEQRTLIEVVHSKNGNQLRFADGSHIDVQGVLMTTGPKEIVKIVKGSQQTALKTWAEGSRPVYAACLDLVLRKLPDPSRDFIVGFWLDRPIFFNNPTSIAKHGREDNVVIHLIKHLGTNPGDPTQDKAELEQAMDIVHPGWRQEEISRQFLPHIVVSHDFYSVDKVGNVPGPQVPDLPGLYVAGDWTGGEEMLADAVFSSAKQAALAIIRQLRNEEANQWKQKNFILN